MQSKDLADFSVLFSMGSESLPGLVLRKIGKVGRYEDFTLWQRECNPVTKHLCVHQYHIHLHNPKVLVPYMVQNSALLPIPVN